MLISEWEKEQIAFITTMLNHAYILFQTAECTMIKQVQKKLSKYIKQS